MAGTGNARGGLGWVILVVALAVPGVLFYNWWSHLKGDREKAVAAKARGRVPDGGVFQSSPNAKLVNPMTPAVSTGTAAPQVAVSTLSVPAAAQAATIATPAGATPAVAIATPTAATRPADISSATAAALPLKRDPTMSPYDQVRLTEAEDAKRRAAEDLAAMQAAKANRGKPRKAVVRDPATLVNLQGIVSNPDSGFKAIVNDEVLGVGELVGSTKVKIIKITDLGVTFSYQGKKFSKGVSRD